ncbi:MAG: SH3 domain-containing protein [Planctomycetota bacterium]|jgi:hypothetical protein
MIPSLSPRLGALAILLAFLSPIPTLTAQAPTPDAFTPGDGVIMQWGGAVYECFQYPQSLPTEAPHETPTGVNTFEPPPTFTPHVYASPTPTAHDQTPTRETTPPPPIHATAQPKPTVTPTARPTPATTPQSACIGTVTSLTGLNVREWPELDAPKLGVLWYGARVELFGITWDNAGGKWYDVRWVDGWGNVYALHIKVNDVIYCGGLTED